MNLRVSSLLVFLVPLACATSSNRPKVDPREVMGRAVSDAVEIPVEADGDRVALAQLSCGGAFATTLGPSQNVVHFRLRIRNLDAEPVGIPVAAVKLEGVGDAPLDKPVTLVGKENHTTEVKVPPGTSMDVDFVFTLPASVDLDELTGFKLVWGVEVGGHLVETESSFTPSGDAPVGQVARAFRPAI